MSFALIHARPHRTTTLLLSWMLFAAGIAAYFYVSHARHRENPEDRVMPTVAQMARGMFDAALRPAEEEEAQPEVAVATAPAGSRLADVAKAAAMKAERTIIEDTLRQVHWNRRRAAEQLGVSYKTLLNKIKECGISRK